MALTPEQVEELKEQLREQVQHLPDQQKQAALMQIASMTPDALESLVQQQRSKQGGDKEQKTIFRMIVDGDVPSTKIDENKEAIAVLDINPISKGHMLIIPKKPVTDAKQMPNAAFSLAKKLAKKITEKLKASNTDLQLEKKFGEVIIDLLPSYDKPLSLSSPRTKASDESLTELAHLLRPVKKPEVIREKKKSSSPSQVLKMQRRIP